MVTNNGHTFHSNTPTQIERDVHRGWKDKPWCLGNL